MDDWYELKVLAVVMVVGGLLLAGLIWMAIEIDRNAVYICDTAWFPTANTWRTTCGWQ